MRSPAWRRHHADQMKRRARRVGQIYSDDDIDVRDLFERKADQLKACSCWMCGNPRRYHHERTHQELRAELDTLDES